MSNHRLKINKVVNKIRKAFFQCAVKFSGNMDSGRFLQTGKTALIASGYRSENFNSKREASILDRVNQRTGKNEMTSKTHRFLHANICRTGAIMAQDDVTKLTGQTAPDGIERKILIISHNIFHLFKVDEKVTASWFSLNMGTSLFLSIPALLARSEKGIARTPGVDLRIGKGTTGAEVIL